jgi:serine phosphatase RsbU (regulator of sigma subunit)
MNLRTRQLLQVLLVLTGVVTVFVVLVTLLFSRSYEVLRVAVLTQGKAHAQTISSNVNFALATGAKAEARDYLRRFAKDHPEALGVAVFDKKGAPFAKVGAALRLPGVKERLEKQKKLKKQKKLEEQARLDGALVLVSTTVVADGDVVGCVVYGASIQRLLDHRSKMASIAIAAFVALLLVVPLLSWLSSRRIVDALRQLTWATGQVSHGDLSVRSGVAGSDELAKLSQQFDSMVAEVGRARTQIAERERLRREMELAESVQTSLLPALAPVDDLNVWARMLPADEIGGDYYDVLRTAGDALPWFAIGDVAGHGLSAGLIMMMTQSSLATAIDEGNGQTSKSAIARVNRVVHGNVRGRWGVSQHMTLTVLRYLGEGSFEHAGAHEELIVWRREQKECELIATRGTWIGAIADISAVTRDQRFELGRGDVLVLYTDGIIEAKQDGGKQRYGIERLCRTIAEVAETPEQIVERVLADVSAFSSVREDDQTIMVIARGA